MTARVRLQLPRPRHFRIPLTHPQFLREENTHDRDEKARHALEDKARSGVGRYSEDTEEYG